MKRITFVFEVESGKMQALMNSAMEQWGYVEEILLNNRINNFSAWQLADFVFCYGEGPDDVNEAQLADKIRALASKLNCKRIVALPGEMKLMYHCIGEVQKRKSLIKHRVFATHLKPGCAAEYKRRHDALIAARNGVDPDGPESNFTIWCANDEYIFGYCEFIKDKMRPETPEEHENTKAWETKQLEIMDWYTDDVDWLTGESHPAARKLC